MMRRGTPSAEFFGELLAMVRTAGTRVSMRQVGERIGSAAATVSQIEKGQRALKEPKIAAWSKALEVDEADLLELWWLCQGEVLVGDRRTFYAGAGVGLGTDPLSSDMVKVLRERPDLEPIYRLAGRIVVVLKRLVPNAWIQVDPADFEPLYIDRVASGDSLTGLEEDEQAADQAAFVHLPIIEWHWSDKPGPSQVSDINARYRVPVPLLQESTPIVRRRTKSLATLELEDLIRDLSGPERERVRGYVEAIVEQRDAGDSPGRTG